MGLRPTQGDEELTHDFRQSAAEDVGYPNLKCEMLL
jgi:hypothetical protein